MSISNTQPDELQLSDFGLVTALLTSGYGIRRTARIGNRVHFVFGKTDTTQQTIDDYWTGILQVYARQYFDNSKMLKSIIYSEKGQQ